MNTIYAYNPSTCTTWIGSSYRDIPDGFHTVTYSEYKAIRYDQLVNENAVLIETVKNYREAFNAIVSALEPLEVFKAYLEETKNVR